MTLITEVSSRTKDLEKRVSQAFENDPDVSDSLKTPEARRSAREKNRERARRLDYEQKQNTLVHKRDRLEWQKKQSIKKYRELELQRKDREARRAAQGNQSSGIQTQTINDTDKDPTAYKKALGNLASIGKHAVGTAFSIGKKEYQKRKDQQSERDKEAETARANDLDKFRKSKIQKFKSATTSAMSQSKRLLPSAPSQMSGREKRTAVSQGKYLGKGQVSEIYSCWREELLYEVDDKKKKKEKGIDYTVDIMKGKNKIIINPNIKEELSSDSLQEALTRIEQVMKRKLLIEARKRDHLANAILSVAFAANLAQSPKNFVRSGHIEGPGMQLMDRMMKRKEKATKNLDHGRVNHPARNRKKLEEAKYDKSNLDCNKPKSDPVGNNTTGKSHVVKSCENEEEKLIRFGQKGVKGSPKKEGESEAYKNRRERFKSRHSKNIKKGKSSAAYWSDIWKW